MASLVSFFGFFCFFVVVFIGAISANSLAETHPSQLEFKVQSDVDGGGDVGGIPNVCGNGALMQQLSEDEYGCYYSGFTLPYAPGSLRSYCWYVVQQNIIGFSWLLNEDSSYKCPSTARYATNTQGHGFCLWKLQISSSMTDVYYGCDYFPSCQQLGYTFRYNGNSTSD